MNEAKQVVVYVIGGALGGIIMWGAVLAVNALFRHIFGR